MRTAVHFAAVNDAANDAMVAAALVNRHLLNTPSPPRLLVWWRHNSTRERQRRRRAHESWCPATHPPSLFLVPITQITTFYVSVSSTVLPLIKVINTYLSIISNYIYIKKYCFIMATITFIFLLYNFYTLTTKFI